MAIGSGNVTWTEDVSVMKYKPDYRQIQEGTGSKEVETLSIGNSVKENSCKEKQKNVVVVGRDMETREDFKKVIFACS